MAVFLLIVMLTWAGCGKKKSSETPPVPAPQSQTQSQATPPGQPAIAPQALRQPTPVAQPGGQTDMAELNRCLLRWVLANRRRPANFEDFAATAGVQIPPPPAGKKYFLGNDMHIALVDH